MFINDQTFALYANPSFIGGMASVLDTGSTLVVYNESRTPVEADIKALRNDWKAVGNDMNFALKEYERTT